MYIKATAVDGVPQVGDRHIINAVSISPTEAICQIDDGEILSNWIELSEEEYNQYMAAYIPPSSTELVQLQPSNAEIQENQLTIMEAIADLYELVRDDITLYYSNDEYVGGIDMVNLFCTLIINKRRSFDQIPDNLKVEVETRLRELGYDTNGYPLVLEE